jgi:hypothetical protein
MNRNLILDEEDTVEHCLELKMLNFIYLSWMEKEKILRDLIPLSCDTPIKNIVLFTIYIKNISNNLYYLCLDHIHDRSRKYYLMQKYTKKWLNFYINKKESVNNTDLELNYIDLNDPQKYYINHIDYKEHKRYLFSQRDFCKIIKTCLENSYEYDIEPLPINIKNPYTNKEFSKTELRNFNSKSRDMPILWIMFVDSDYDLVKFKHKYYDYLLELCIPNYVDKLEDQDMIDYIIDIFLHNNKKYCTKCLLYRKCIRDKKVKNCVTNWIRYLKLNKYFQLKYMTYLSLLYGKFLCSCTRVIKDEKEDKEDKDNKEDKDFTIGIDFTQPLFTIGYKGCDDKSEYWIKKKMIERKKRYKLKIKNLEFVLQQFIKVI